MAVTERQDMRVGSKGREQHVVRAAGYQILAACLKDHSVCTWSMGTDSYVKLAERYEPF